MSRITKPLSTSGLFRAVILLITLALPLVLADPATLAVDDCFDKTGNHSTKLNVSNVYAEVVHDDSLGTYLNLVIIGNSPQDIIGFSNDSTNLATLFTTTSLLTLNVWTNSSYLCSSLRPPSPLPTLANDSATYCPIPAGDFAFSSSIFWGDHRALTTLTTRLRAVDPFSNELLCLTVSTTPLDPTPGNPYGSAKIIFWGTVGLAIAYWIVIGIARITSAWGRGITRPDRNLWARAQSAGFILASAISGERLATSPALLRYSTPSMRDIIFHTQWCSVLAMVAVQWPPFVYPLLTQTAWATLTYNVTLTDGSKVSHWDPLSTLAYNPPENFTSQLADSSSRLYLNPSVSNILFTLPTNASSGLSSFAYSAGLRPQDLFSTSLIIFLAVIAATITISLLIWLIDYVACFIISVVSHKPMSRLAGARSPGFSSVKELDTAVPVSLEEGKSLSGRENLFRPSSRLTLSGAAAAVTSSPRKPWYRVHTELSSFHGSVLHGNLVRILMLFHLPITIFSVYEMTLPSSVASRATVVLAGISFAILSVLIPAFLVVRVRLTTTNKLYDETRTLLSLGPLYNHYRHGSQMFASLLFVTNLVIGVTVGAGQKSGTAQAIILLVVEVVSALVTSIWLPWGTGAGMGLISFLFCVARIVITVLMVILTPTISIGAGAGGWVAYGILVILALIYLALLLMLLVKLVEALVRIIGGVGFDKSNHVVDTGLIGACGLLGCCGSRKRRRGHRSKSRNHRYRPSEGAPLKERDRSKRDSDISSYLPPHAFRDPSAGSKKGSMHSSASPPSVLKPEHALRPYREESDDESGYIMGAWQPFPRPGYVPVVDPPSPKVEQKQPATSSGFSRVGGGRAHIDSPYAITGNQDGGSTSSLAFPSKAPQQGTPSTSKVVFDDDDMPPISLSSSNLPRQRNPEMVTAAGGLPPGAMQPHMRTKSQTAIIEHAGGFGGLVGGTSQSANVLLDVGPTTSVEKDEDTEQKKKPWYHIRRHRPHSTGTEDTPDAPGPSANEEAALNAASSSSAPPGRSFVVIRKPQGSPGRSLNLSTGSTPTATRTPTSDSFGRRTGNSGSRADVRTSSYSATN